MRCMSLSAETEMKSGSICVWRSGGSQGFAVNGERRREQHVRLCQSVSSDKFTSSLSHAAVYTCPL